MQTQQPGLRRSLGAVSSVAMAFAAGGVSAGVFSLFGFSLSMSGPSMVWGWVLVGLGTLTLCLVWAELASHYPLAGSMYQWPRKLASERTAWWVGWMYLFAMMFQLAGIYFILPSVLLPLLGVAVTTQSQVLVALIALVVAAVANVSAIERVGKLTAIATGAELVLIFGITLAAMVFGHHNGPSEYFRPAVAGQGFGTWLAAFAGGGVFLGLWVMLGFETGGTIGEETRDAPRLAPRAILGGWAGAFVVGLFIIIALVSAAPDLGAVAGSPSPVLDIIDGALGGGWGKVYLAILAVVILLGANAIFTAVTRQVYGMARAGLLPFSRHLRRTLARTGEPWVAVAAITVITALPFFIADEFTVLAVGATGAVYAVYFALAGLTLVARVRRGWPRQSAPFALGRWGLPVNVLAVVYAGAAFVDLFWFRDATNPAWKLGIPVTCWLLGLPLILGGLYWLVRARTPAPQLAEEIS